MTHDRAIRDHCREIDRCNQRGGRMLSAVDLLEAQTLNLEMAAYLLDRIGRGASFLVGANPGGAGKTTLMGALLNFLPSEVPIVAATQGAVASAGRGNPARACYLCHEIGSGGYFAYLWGQSARDYFALSGSGHILATNLHADTLAQCHAQLCGENRVPESDFRRVDLMLFLSVTGSLLRPKRRIAAVYAAEAGGPHELVFRYTATGWERLGPPPLPSEADCRQFLHRLAASGRQTIREVRRAVLDWRAEAAP